MNYSTVISERVGDVGVVTLNRPEKMNAINRAMINDLDDAIHRTKRTVCEP